MEFSGQNTGYGFNAMDFSNIDFGTTFPQEQQSFEFMKGAEGNTDANFFFGDEGIDATGSFNQQSFDSLNANAFSTASAEPSFAMQQNLVRVISYSAVMVSSDLRAQ